MDLMPPELAAEFKRVGSQEHLELNARIIAKYFNPCGAQTWYCTEFDPIERTFFGYADLGFGPGSSELGYVSLDELQSIRLPFGLTIERDLFYGDHTLAEVMQ